MRTFWSPGTSSRPSRGSRPPSVTFAGRLPMRRAGPVRRERARNTLSRTAREVRRAPKLAPVPTLALRLARPGPAAGQREPGSRSPRRRAKCRRPSSHHHPRKPLPWLERHMRGGSYSSGSGLSAAMNQQRCSGSGSGSSSNSLCISFSSMLVLPPRPWVCLRAAPRSWRLFFQVWLPQRNALPAPFIPSSPSPSALLQRSAAVSYPEVLSSLPGNLTALHAAANW
jgi:hypothetical protein